MFDPERVRDVATFERPLAYALPALVPAALWCLRRFLDETALPAVPVLAVAVALQVVFWAGQRFAEAGMVGMLTVLPKE